jgi:hypothetical protein
MSQNKRTIIRTETREVWVVRRRGGKPKCTHWCEECRNESEWLTLLDTARLSGITLKEIMRLIKVGLIHFQETPDGESFACGNSLVAAMHI